MIKRINKYLVENHPMIWNAKIVWMLLILLGLHLGFYVAGFLSFNNIGDLQNYGFFAKYFRGGAVWIGILLSILIFILWMKSYFKQNAFKSFYPKSNASLFAEFVLVFVICFLTISFYFPYTEGLRQRVSNSITEEELKQELDIMNKGAAFTLQSENDYAHFHRCFSLPLFDSLVNEDEVVQLYIKNAVKNVSSRWTNVNPKDYMLYKDSIPQPYYINFEYTTLLKEHFPKRIKEYADKKEETVYNETQALNSIYNYCKYPILFKPDNEDYFTADYEEYELAYELGIEVASLPDNEKSSPRKSKEAQYYALYIADLLQNNKKEEIEKLLDDYLVLADKYKISYRFKDKKWIDYVYNPPYYFVDDDLKRRYDYSSYDKGQKEIDHIMSSDLDRSMNNLIESKFNVISIDNTLIFLYIALFFAILIYAFRVTSLRIWLMSFVGAIVVMFIYFALFFFLELTGIIDYTNDNWMSIQYLLFVLIFWIFTAFCLKKQKMKKWAGMTLNWGIVSFPAVFPLLISIYNKNLPYPHPHPHTKWINEHFTEIAFFNIALFFVFLFLIIPLIKKWKSLPEE